MQRGYLWLHYWHQLHHIVHRDSFYWQKCKWFMLEIAETEKKVVTLLKKNRYFSTHHLLIMLIFYFFFDNLVLFECKQTIIASHLSSWLLLFEKIQVIYVPMWKVRWFQRVAFLVCKIDPDVTSGSILSKCDELASRTPKDLNSCPSSLRQNVDINQNLYKQINSFHIQNFQDFENI